MNRLSIKYKGHGNQNFKNLGPSEPYMYMFISLRKKTRVFLSRRLLILYLECLHHDMKSDEISQMTELLSSYAQRANNAMLNSPLELSKKGMGLLALTF